jgi:hypothetical protein
VPWYVWLYLIYLSVLIIAAAFDDLRDHEPFLVIVIDLLEGCIYWIMIVFWHRSAAPDWLAPALAPMLLLALGWTAKRARDAWIKITRTGEDKKAVAFGFALAVASISPAYWMGVRLVLRDGA